jgi:hypothetical protein
VASGFSQHAIFAELLKKNNHLFGSLKKVCTFAAVKHNLKDETFC